MKSKYGISVLLLVAVALIFASSCSKNNSGDIPKEDLALAKDEAYVDAVFDEVDNMALDEVVALDNDDYGFTTFQANINFCYTVSVNSHDTTSFPKTVTIDFGDGCTTIFNGDTITRSGQIVITVTNRWFVLGAQHIITFNNFYFNGAKVEGTRTVTNDGISSNRFVSSVVLEEGKITFDEDTYITRSSNHVREWARHLNPMNDTIYVTGSANGINILGESYERNILEPLEYIICPNTYWWGLAGGKVEITNNVRGSFTIEHTGESCSGDVIIEKDGSRYTYNFLYRYTRK